MFDFKKNKRTSLFAPVNGQMIPLENVPDKVFASHMMGEGVAFIYEDNIVCAPCDGRVTLIAPTLHAFGMMDSCGAEILVHIGLDTVNLQGKGFKVLVNQREKVSKGTPIIEIDRDYMRNHDIVLTTPVVITNAKDFEIDIQNCTRVEKGVTEVLNLKKI